MVFFNLIQPKGFGPSNKELKNAPIPIDDNWVPDYAEKVHQIVEKHGGKYLSRSGNIKILEGEDWGNTFIAILQFPDAASVKAFATDTEYVPHGKARQEGVRNGFQLIDDTDAAGTMPIYLRVDFLIQELPAY